MPTLTWASKALLEFPPASLVMDSIVYPQRGGYASDCRRMMAPDSREFPENRLILGDNLLVMASLLPEYAGQIDLIYSDPPFFTNRAYPARVGRGEDSRRPREWQLAEGYADHWSNLDAYLDFLYPRLALMYQLLAPTGTFYLHLDWHANSYARLLLDEIFGPERLLNEIVWCYHGPSPIRSAFNRKHDTLLVYTKSSEYTFNVDAVRQPYDPSTLKTFASSSKAGFGKVPDLERGKVPEDWWYFPVVARLHTERTGYPTQKPEALLERIILASSNPGDVVADFFCGSGTTAVVSARHQRRFIANDVTFRAVHTARTRLARPSSHPDETQPSWCEPFWVQSVSPGVDFQSSQGNLFCRGQTISLDPEILPGVDFWEVDPAWDGKIFHSAAQAVRPRKNQPITGAIHLPVTPGKSVCVRWVTVDGQSYQSIIER
jgi:DNA modification methylase